MVRWKKKKVIFFLFTPLFFGICIVALLTPTFLNYITLEKQWYKKYGGEGTDVCCSSLQTADGGYALAGTTYSSGAGASDMWLVKTDVNGVEQWNATYGGEGTDVCCSSLQTTDGGYALAGYTNSSGAGTSDMWLVKTDNKGVHQWNGTYGGEGMDVCWSLLQTADGGYALAGYTNSSGTSTNDIWLVKTDINGIQKWNQTYQGLGALGVSILQTEDGEYILMHHNLTDVEFYGLFNFTLKLYCIKMIKIDVDGFLLWNQTFFISYPYFLHNTHLIQTMDGGLALSGVGFLENFDSVRTVIVKTDVDGNSQWVKTYKEYKEGETQLHLVSSLLQTTDGDFILAGSVLNTFEDSLDPSISDFWLGIVILNVDQISCSEFLPLLIAICVITKYTKKQMIKSLD